MSKHHIHPALDELYAKHPRNAVQLNAAYELGLGNLAAALENSSRKQLRREVAPGTQAVCINDFPVQFVHVLNTAVVARCLDLLLPHFYEAVTKDERRIMGGMAGVLKQFQKNVLDVLTSRAVFRATDERTVLQAGQGYSEDLADLLYECLHQMNSHEDPRAPHAAMVMFTEFDMLAKAPEETEETAVA